MFLNAVFLLQHNHNEDVNNGETEHEFMQQKRGEKNALSDPEHYKIKALQLYLLRVILSKKASGEPR